MFIMLLFVGYEFNYVERENLTLGCFQYSDLKGRITMGARKKVSRPKSSVTVRDPHYQEFDTHKERNIQKPLHRST